MAIFASFVSHFAGNWGKVRFEWIYRLPAKEMQFDQIWQVGPNWHAFGTSVARALLAHLLCKSVHKVNNKMKNVVTSGRRRTEAQGGQEDRREVQRSSDGDTPRAHAARLLGLHASVAFIKAYLAHDIMGIIQTKKTKQVAKP